MITKILSNLIKLGANCSKKRGEKQKTKKKQNKKKKTKQRKLVTSCDMQLDLYLVNSTNSATILKNVFKENWFSLFCVFFLDLVWFSKLA